ncbi:hypothetical protein TNIN_19431 [Trichonephila inaurata madagascariensis]|uniref:Uncharacterized protein n=1 Tax=Trichonephila inaurata madagascariensis TaxID=2747483 RepID=A0A8X6J6W4_9ARAC|nr:hypothetical protein TNIN_19431 [Trichonephila inaurata madagascariensis]
MLSQEDIPVSSLWDLELLGIRETIEQNSRKEKEKEINICHERQFQSQKEEFDSELKKEDQKLAEILENSEKFSKIIIEQNVTIAEKDEMLLDLQNQIKTRDRNKFI